MEFLKLEGCGNDFVCVEAALAPSVDRAALARALCDRHFGVGADGLMLLEPDDEADGAMVFLNPDGSDSATCGNALRCAAMVLAERFGRCDVSIRSGREVRACTVIERSGSAARVRVSMGRVVLERSCIPMLGQAGHVVEEPFVLQAGLATPQSTTSTGGALPSALRITALSLGNPHCVVFVDEARTAPVSLLGSSIETDPRFPERTNIEFTQVLSRTRLLQRTWERGVGETPACGSGACASVVAGVLTGRCERRTTVELQGGMLEVEWPALEAEVQLTGPARLVFRGIWRA